MKTFSVALLLAGCMLSSAASAHQWKHHWKHKMPAYEHSYLRVDAGDTRWFGNAGYIHKQLPSRTNTDMVPYWNMSKSANLGVGIGAKLSHHLRTDLTLTQTRYATNDAQNVQVNNESAADNADVYVRTRARTTLVNLYWDLGHFSRHLARHRIQPYVGGGVGASYNTMNGMTGYATGTTNIYGHIPGHSNWAGAFQYGAGLAYKLQNAPVSLDFSYMFLDAGKVKSTSQMDVNLAPAGEQLLDRTKLHLRGERWALGLRWHI